jgi:hypothetical protein
MNKLFSYSLFEPKVLPSIRSWDRWKESKDRYWYNIPTILLINKMIYPEYKSSFHLSPNIWNNPLSAIFDIFEVDTNTIQREYSITEPAIWRMMPLWDRRIDIFHARDVDSLTSESEYKYIKMFEGGDCTVGTIRSHENHYGIACRMLAGLSSFKPKLIPLSIKGMNFDFYYSQRDSNYGSDQNLMIKVFTSNESFTEKNFLDCKIDKQQNNQNFSCIQADLNNITVDENISNIFSMINKYTNTSWLGEPCDSRGELLNYLLDRNNEIKKKITSNKILSNFYKVI